MSGDLKTQGEKGALARALAELRAARDEHDAARRRLFLYQTALMDMVHQHCQVEGHIVDAALSANEEVVDLLLDDGLLERLPGKLDRYKLRWDRHHLSAGEALALAEERREKEPPGLYVWEDVLQSYAPGIMFALALDADHARRLIKEKVGYDSTLVDLDLSRDPRVVTEPEGFYLWGGE
jgi:hypothetical protein